jgi:hypothetical protein
MHEASAPAASAPAASQASADTVAIPDWRGLLEESHSALVEELGRAIEAERRAAAARAADAERERTAACLDTARSEARRQQTEVLHQALRRLRLISENREILRFLNESTAPYAERSVVVVFENSQAVMVALRGCEDMAPATFEIAAAPALASAIESRDPVVALATAAELSPLLAAALENAGTGENGQRAKAYLFPVTVRQSVRAILITAGAVVAAPIELLCEAAGMKLEAIEFPPARDSASMSASISASRPMPGSASSVASSGTLPLMPAVPASATSSRRSWAELPAEDQRLHLQAQHTARVRVATLRLDNDEALRRGIAGRDIYGALKKEIDAERHDFLETYLSKSDTMVDYLHLEIVARLAHEDEKLLGAGYPGPMV